VTFVTRGQLTGWSCAALSAFPWPYTTIRIFSRTTQETTPPEVISSGKLFARYYFFTQKTVLRLLDSLFGMSRTICFMLHNDTLLLYAASFYSTGHTSLWRVVTILLPPIRTPAPDQEWRNAGHLAKEEVVVVLVDKIGLCWRGDFPPTLTCASQVSLIIPFSTTMTTNRLLSYPISQLWIFQVRFSIFAYLVPATSSGTGTSVGCHSSSHSIQITIHQKTRRTLSTKRKPKV
jgi:hypothetical protein